MNAANLLRAFLEPHILPGAIIRSLSLGSVDFRLAMQALDKAQHAFGITQAIYLASRLNLSRVSVIEFGVRASVVCPHASVASCPPLAKKLVGPILNPLFIDS